MNRTSDDFNNIELTDAEANEIEMLYAEMLDRDVPDLWDRIEKGIDNNESSKVTSIKEAREKAARKKMIGIITASAAALLLIAIPAAFLSGSLFNRTKYDATSDAQYEDVENVASDEAADEAFSFDSNMDIAGAADSSKDQGISNNIISYDVIAEDAAEDDSTKGDGNVKIADNLYISGKLVKTAAGYEITGCSFYTEDGEAYGIKAENIDITTVIVNNPDKLALFLYEEDGSVLIEDIEKYDFKVTLYETSGSDKLIVEIIE